jgi:hypothetical protein
MERIQLPAPLLRRTDLGGAHKRPSECLFEFRPPGDLAAYVVDDAA